MTDLSCRSALAVAPLAAAAAAVVENKRRVVADRRLAVSSRADIVAPGLVIDIPARSQMLPVAVAVDVAAAVGVLDD